MKSLYVTWSSFQPTQISKTGQQFYLKLNQFLLVYFVIFSLIILYINRFKFVIRGIQDLYQGVINMSIEQILGVA